MPTSELPSLEPDTRLPSGEWTGFYLEEHKPKRSWMHLYLHFEEHEIRGEGTDYVGPWLIKGTYDLENSICHWYKQYLKKHRVQYTGTITDSGIEGSWNIRDWNSGPFHIWPHNRSDLTNLFLKDDLDRTRSSILLGSAPPKSLF
ncbi:MAG: hypothetical protein P8J33_10985 [Pirellulaceae bacterium]|nr:hypothetical protein [Pirellulaceae bacterium]